MTATTSTTSAAPLASLVCPNLKCRKFQTLPQEKRGTVIPCVKCGVRILVGETQQTTARFAGGDDFDHEGGIR